MITYFEMPGRFGNIILSIYTVFKYCQIHKIDYNKIIFSKNGLCNKTFFSKEVYPFLSKIYNYNFIDHKVYLEAIKSCIKIRSSYEFMGDDNICFIGYKWLYPTEKDINSMLLWAKLFYNPEYYTEAVKNTVPQELDISKCTAIHIRRTDFVNLCSKYVLKIDRINLSIDKSENPCIIFSDDIEWCEENIKNNKVIYFVKNKDTAQSWATMSMCKNIVQNPYSTYSLTARYTNTYIYKYLKYQNNLTN